MNMRTLFVSAFGIFAALGACGDTYTVDNVTDLTNRLEILNRKRNSSHRLYIKPGHYDVSKCVGTYWDTNGDQKFPGTCLAYDYITIEGTSGNARDVVIYGDATKTIFYSYQGWLRHVTVSNGCLNAYGSNGGGGITTYSTGAQYSNVVVTCCSVEKGSYGGGGTGLGTYYNCTIISNRSNGSGGGVTGVASSSAVFRNCLIANNYAKGSGGGAYNCILINCVVSNNTCAGSGGGMYVGYTKGKEPTGLALTNTVFIGNYTKSAGGALYIDSTTRCARCTFVGNSAVGSGGAIYTSHPFWLNSCIVSNNVASANGGGSCGGCIYEDCDIVFNRGVNTNASISQNFYGGGICYGTARNCLIAGNGGFYNRASNRSTYAGGAHQATLIGCRIFNNFCQGSGAAMRDGKAVGCIFSNNVAGASGSWTIQEPSSALSNCTFYGTHFYLGAKSSLVNCRVLGFNPYLTLAPGANCVTSGTFWAGSFVTEGAFAATNCLFAENRVGSLFRNNKSSTPIVLVNCTVASNTCDYTFNEFYTSSANYKQPAICINSIFAENVNSSGKAYDLNYDAAQANLSFTNCLIGPKRPATAPALGEVGTVTAATVRFANDGSADPYALYYGSRARRKGLVMDWMAGATDIRGAGYPRLREGEADIGCYQFWLPRRAAAIFIR